MLYMGINHRCARAGAPYPGTQMRANERLRHGGGATGTPQHAPGVANTQTHSPQQARAGEVGVWAGKEGAWAVCEDGARVAEWRARE